MSETYRRKPPKNIEGGGTYRKSPLKSAAAERTVKHNQLAQHIATSELHKREHHNKK